MAGTARGHARLSLSRRLAFGVVAVATFAAVPAAPGGAAGDFQATASADGVRVGVAVRRFLVVEQFVDAGAPSAQAHVDSLGNSQAWAAYPFPSDLVISVPGTVAGFGPPGLPALPEYPLYASARHPTKPSAETGDSGYTLRSKAEEQAATATAEAGVANEAGRVGLTRSAASAVRNSNSEVRAEAESAVEAFAVGDVLRIGRVSSRATATTHPGGPVTRHSETKVAEATVGGQTVAIGGDGITTPGGDGPLPDSSPARQALAQAGVTLRYLAPIETDTGVVAAGIEVSVVRELPGIGDALITYVLGRASASTEASADPFSVPVPAELPPEPPSEVGAEANGGPGPEPLPYTAPREAAGVASFSPPPGPAPGTGAAVPPSVGPPATEGGARPSDMATPPAGESAAPGASLLPSQAAATVIPGPDFSGFLPILGAGGLMVAAALVLASRAMRRAAWTS